MIHDYEKVEDLGLKGYKIIQDKSGFCFGSDAVLLSRFVKIKKGARVLDMCSGTGIIPVLLWGMYEPSEIQAIEIVPEVADMAGRTMELNFLSDKIHVHCDDLKNSKKLFGAHAFDAVTCNPPYMTGKHGLTNPELPKAIARHEILCSLEDVVRSAAKVVKPGGRFYMVHRPFRLAEILNVLVQYKLEPKRMRLVYPYVDKEPNMVLIEGARGGKSRMTVEKPLIVYEKPGVYTREIYEIYGEKPEE